MEKIKIRKDANGNIISKTDKNYHITICENFVTIIEVPSFKQYNILNDDYNDDDEEEEIENKSPFVENYNIRKVENVSTKDPRGISKVKCIII